MGNVYMEADQVRFKDSTYRNVQEGLAAALEGGGGGGTTVVANPEGSATVDLAKLQVGTTIYGIPETAAKVTYDNTSSGLAADDVQEAIDELNTGLSGVTELIPSGATSSNKLATASDIPGTATTSAAGIVQPDGTSITINDGVISAIGGGGGETYSATETVIGTWMGKTHYRKSYDITGLNLTAGNTYAIGTGGDYDTGTIYQPQYVTNLRGIGLYTNDGGTTYGAYTIPWASRTDNTQNLIMSIDSYGRIYIGVGSTSTSTITQLKIVIEYTKS